jgi:hypothetical protein
VLPYLNGSSLYILVNLFMVNVSISLEFKVFFFKFMVYLSYLYQGLLQVESKLFLGHKVGDLFSFCRFLMEKRGWKHLSRFF